MQDKGQGLGLWSQRAREARVGSALASLCPFSLELLLTHLLWLKLLGGRGRPAWMRKEGHMIVVASHLPQPSEASVSGSRLLQLLPP